MRTWGRSFARLAEWQTRLLTEVALESDDPVEQVTSLTEEVMPRLETLQNYVWRQHLAKASRRMMTTDSLGSDVTQLAVGVRRHRRVHLAEQGAERRRARLLDRALRGRVLGRRQRPRRPGDQEHRRRGPVRRRRPHHRGRRGAGADRQGSGRPGRVPLGPRRPRVRRGGGAPRRRARTHGQHRVPAHLDRAARDGPGRRRCARAALRRRLAVRLPQAAADLGQGLRPPAALGTAPQGLASSGYRPPRERLRRGRAASSGTPTTSRTGSPGTARPGRSSRAATGWWPRRPARGRPGRSSSGSCSAWRT